jgi:hypothetical protein
MESAGYSGKSLSSKLGIKEGNKISVINAPQNYFSLLGDLSAVNIFESLRGTFDLIHIFCTDAGDVKKKIEQAKNHIPSNGVIWISWMKQSSGIKSGLNENIIRNIGLESGLVDVKVCAVDERWSALKFVFRLKDRK